MFQPWKCTMEDKADKLSATKCKHFHWSTGHSTKEEYTKE